MLSFFFPLSLALCLRVVFKRNASGADSWVVSYFPALVTALLLIYSRPGRVGGFYISIQVVLWPCLIYHAAIL